MAVQLNPQPVAPIDAAEKRIQDIFHDDYAFEIPAYQRPYAWETEQIDQLLSDLLDAMDAPTAATGGVYFLGSIVLIKTRGEPQARVIDGQQRLTTLTILFAVLRDLTTDQEVKFERDTYIKQKGSRDRGTEDRMRLQLRDSDQAFFRERVQTRDGTSALPRTSGLDGSQLRIVENAQYLRAKLARMSEEQRDKLIHFILTRAYLVVVSVPTQETARRIFTVLNARGLDLTPTDILKADLLDRITAPAELKRAQERELAKRWEACENSLGRDQFVTLFTHVRMIDEREKPREALETAFPKKVKSFKAEPEHFISEILEPYSDAFSTLLDEREIDALYGPEARASVAALHRLDNTDWQPPALAFLVKFSDDAEVSEGATGFFSLLERLAYHLFLTRADVNARIRRHADVIADILRARRAIDPLPSIELSAGDRRSTIEAIDGPIYKRGRVCKPLLLRLDEVLSNGAASYSGDVTIEHVLPQTVGANSPWALIFPDLATREEWTHRLANLVLLNRRANTSAGNWDFEKKKTQYFQRRDGRNPFPLTQEVLGETEWSPAVLKRRQSHLVQVLSDHWNLN